MTACPHPASPHPLDNPIWSALCSRQAPLGMGDAAARRYSPDVAPFGAIAADTPEAWRDLVRLLGADDKVALLSAAPLAAVDGLKAQTVGVIHQMVAPPMVEPGMVVPEMVVPGMVEPGMMEAGMAAPQWVASRLPAGQTGRAMALPELADAPDITPLEQADVPDMLALAQKTRPGPFCARTHEMGRYLGIRHQGALIAMAGERMRPDGFVEISAVCVDPLWRGKGLAGRLITRLQDDIQQRGETPFLHVLSDNGNAIALYERLGYRLRRRFFFGWMQRAD